MRLTGRGVAALVASLSALAAGGWGRLPLLTALGALWCGVLLVSVLRTGAAGAEVHRTLRHDRVQRGRPVPARLRVTAGGARRAGGLLVTDTAGGVVHTVRVRPPAPGDTAVYHYELPTGARGRLVVGPLVLHRDDPLGLARSRHPAADSTTTLWVHPRQYPARVPGARDARREHDGSTNADLRGSAELRDVREYVAGDEVRHVHWKATARTGRLMVRDLADRQRGSLTVLLDDRAEALGAAAFEEAVDVAASLLGASARAGRDARLVTSSGRELPVRGGPQGVRWFLDATCDLRQDAAADDALVPGVLAAGRPAGGALVIVTTGAEGRDVAGLRHRFATVVVIVPTVGPTGGRAAGIDPAGVRVIRADGAGQAVSRWNAAIR